MATVPDSSLEAGLAALKQGDYSTAIAHLEAICQTQQNQPSQVKAQMGLVVAYEHTGETSRALALCQTLSNSTNHKVREWAVRNHAELTNRYLEATTTAPENDVTGFVAFDSQPVKSQKSKVSTQESEKSPLLPCSPTPPSLQWRQAGRAKRWTPLALNLIPLWLLQFGTATLLFWLIRELLKFIMAGTNTLLVKLPYLEPFQLFYRDPTQFVLLTLGIMLIL